MANYQIEISRNNITLAQFFAMVKFECKKKGIDFYMTKEEFENPPSIINNRYFNGNPIENACKSEILLQSPLNTQTYMLNFDGSCYNEICEFTFDDEKTGHGYYYQVNRDVV